jgi:5-methylcytosine-specific restriction enzyme A
MTLLLSAFLFALCCARRPAVSQCFCCRLSYLRCMLPSVSTNRTSKGGWVRNTKQRGSNGRGICRRCGQEVPPRRRTFCSDECVHEWRLRTDPGYLREQVLQRDHGVCAICGLDALEFYRRFRLLPSRKRSALRRSLDMPPHRENFWDADHVVPVVEGGGECGIGNLRTLCLWCHQAETARLRLRRTAAKKKSASSAT